MTAVLRLATPGRQCGSVTRSRVRLLAIASAFAASLVLAFSASAHATVSGPFCGASNGPITLHGGQGCTHGIYHNLFTVEGHADLTYTYMCALAKGNSAGTGGNTLPANCGQVGTYAISSDCPYSSGCGGYAKITNENTVDRRVWGYLYAYS